MTISIYCKYNNEEWNTSTAIAREWGYGDEGEWVEKWRHATAEDKEFAAEWIPTDFPQSAKGYVRHSDVEKNAGRA